MCIQTRAGGDPRMAAAVIAVAMNPGRGRRFATRPRGPPSPPRGRARVPGTGQGELAARLANSDG